MERTCTCEACRQGKDIFECEHYNEHDLLFHAMESKAKVTRVKMFPEAVVADLKAQLAEKEKETDGVMCPFCEDDGFDLPGLKWHLVGRCKVYNKTKDIR